MGSTGDFNAQSSSSLSSFLDSPAGGSDHVLWQSSQCTALNKLIQANSARVSSGWPDWGPSSSLDSIPGLSDPTEELERMSASSILSVHSPIDTSEPAPHPRTFSRPRHSHAYAESRHSTPTTHVNARPPVFFNTRDPSQFLALLKGVSAKVEENVRVNSSGATHRFTGKRPRPSSFETSGTQPKKGRVADELRVVEVKDKEGCAISRASPCRLPRVGRDWSLRNNHSDTSSDAFQDSPMHAAPKSSTSAALDSSPLPWKDDVGNNAATPAHYSKEVAATTATLGRMDIGTRKGRQFMRTPSQVSMPPPPGRPSASTARMSKDGLDDQGSNHPRLHPLLIQQQQALKAKSVNSSFMMVDSSSESSTALLSSRPKPLVPAHPKTPTPSTSQPPDQPPSLTQPQSQRLHPPVLGMRRTRTYPVTNGTTSGNKQSPKTFKPPLLSLQPELTTKVEPRKESASIPSTRVISKISSTKLQNQPREMFFDPPTNAGPEGQVGIRVKSGVYSDMAVAELPEPEDGDANSSFGDVSFNFDMDALEETMQKYD